MNSLIERRVRTLADEQGGVATRRQALALGMTDRMIEKRVAAGLWRRVKPGVFRIAPGPNPVMESLAAATAALPAVVSHESAAELHELAHTRRGLALVTVPTRCSNRFPGVIVRQSTDLTSDFVVLRFGLPTTSVVRTIVDLAGHLRPRRLESVVDDCLVMGLADLEELEDVLERLARRGKPGVRQLRSILEAKSPGCAVPESELERRFLEVLAWAGLPPPILQYPLPWRTYQAGRADGAYPDARLLIEADGRRWHTRSEAFETDRRRDNLAMLAGWRVLRFTWHDIEERPGEVVRMVREALASDTF